MAVRDTLRPYPFEPWGFDNGAFVAWRKGLPFPEARFLRRLELALKVAHSDPYLAVTPDIVAGGMRSLEFSVEWRYRLPGHWPWYLAVQDGMEPEAVEEVLHLFSGVFLGGTDGFKGTARFWCRMAHRRGIKFHYARAGTIPKLIHAYDVGADSLDSATMLGRREKLRRFTIAYVDREVG